MIWLVKYLTHPASYYPVQTVGMKLQSTNQGLYHDSIKYDIHARVGTSKMAIQSSKMSVQQLSTMDKPGTLPIRAYIELS